MIRILKVEGRCRATSAVALDHRPAKAAMRVVARTAWLPAEEI